ncbi:unnamed protein product [Protopolystoma xenopodis]|uniref:Uncharacterized protein n=1 Tax=Protopolystoma xenopodis TaxID=117903 RepID=A0A3S5CPT6_9PLAT|nr:unnamed protein product [Protopolystoma xenopodis]
MQQVALSEAGSAEDSVEKQHRLEEELSEARTRELDLQHLIGEFDAQKARLLASKEEAEKRVCF